MKISKDNSLIPGRIERVIFLIHGQKVILDKDLAMLYQVSTRDLNKAVNRNLDRFPEDFMFQLTKEEFKNLKFHFGTSSWGGTRKRPPRSTYETRMGLSRSPAMREIPNPVFLQTMGNLRPIWKEGGEEKGWADFEWTNMGRNSDSPLSRLVKTILC